MTKLKVDYATLYKRYLSNYPRAFLGGSILKHRDVIRRLMHEVKPARVLDYGCGRAEQYRIHLIHRDWPRPKRPVLYDPAVWHMAVKPLGVFQAILCTDVMEHIHEEDVPIVLQEIFDYIDKDAAQAFTFFSICCRPAKKFFQDGRNVHLTVKPPTWWDDQFSRVNKPKNVRVVRVYTGALNEDT